jgi:serine/threonine-protein kinase
MPESPPNAVTLPAHLLAHTTIAPTEVGDLPPDALVDDTFAGRYAVGDTLGEGGMGVVRRCVDRRIGREVAIKSVKGTATEGGLGARFLHEACVQGQLEHPAIVSVYDVGRDGDGVAYFTMKRVRGVTLERVVDSLRAGDPDAARQYSRRKLLSAFVRVCEAIDFAHSRGVVHRDLKPGNVMLGDYGEVYVLDWGLAKLVSLGEGSADAGAPVLTGRTASGTRTALGARLGTPGYMAPEQVRGEEVDARADVYALGSLLFELLAREPLHPHESPQATIESTLAGLDARPSARAPQLDSPPELDAVCVRATALDRADRFAGVRDLLAAVERYLDGDRDLERRRALAAEYARAGLEHAKNALGGPSGTAARREALREVGRALALDPSNEDAVRTFMEMMTTLPPEIPPEVREALDADARLGVQTGARWSVPAYVCWFLHLPLMLWMGIRSVPAYAASTAAWVVAAAVAYVVSRRPPQRPHQPTALAFVSALGVATTSTICGPYMLAPTLAAIGTMLLHMAPGRAGRVTAVGLHCFAIAIPAFLQWSGVMPSSYVFAGDSLTIHAGMLYFPPIPTQAFLLLSNVSVVIAAAFLMARFRNALSRVEQRLHVQAWQLRQLVPDSAHTAATALLPRSFYAQPSPWE